jgi:hypothetical protein
MRPDGTPEGLAAYRRELRGVAAPWRYAGLAIVTLGAVVMIAYGRGPQGITETYAGSMSIAFEVVGWAMLIYAIVYRTRYHKARMAEPAGGEG